MDGEVMYGGRCSIHHCPRPCKQCGAERLAAGEAAAYGIIDPDYARIFTQARIVAWQYGFACVMHGSFTRDLDLLLVPWEERASDKTAEQVIRIIADACGLNQNGGDESMKLTYKEELKFTDKPHGRRAISLHLPGFKERRWVDISVLPCKTAAGVALPADPWDPAVSSDAQALIDKAIAAAVERIQATIIVEGEPPEKLLAAVLCRVADIAKPTWNYAPGVSASDGGTK